MELRPDIGTLGATLFENEHVGVPLSLFFDVVIPIEPFEFDGENVKTSVRLEFIEMPVDDWRDLAGREFTFPTNPEPGYIDASLYLGHVHNPVDVTRIRFAHPTGNVWPVAIDMVVDFTYEGPQERGRVSLDWHTDLTFEHEVLDRIFAEGRTRGAR